MCILASKTKYWSKPSKIALRPCIEKSTHCLDNLWNLKGILTHFGPMLHFYSPWKLQNLRFSDFFRGYLSKWIIGLKWVKSKLTLRSLFWLKLLLYYETFRVTSVSSFLTWRKFCFCKIPKIFLEDNFLTYSEKNPAILV